MGGKKRSALADLAQKLKKTVSFIEILGWKCFQQLIR